MNPIVQALLIADHIYQDVHTGKRIVAGIFHTIYTSLPDSTVDFADGESVSSSNNVFPAGAPFAYLSLLNIQGEQSFDLR